MHSDPKRIADTRAWFSKAAFDLRAAEAVEKALKSFLTWHDRPLRKTHNLVEIGGQCATFDPGLEPLLRRAAPLTEYAWRFRYPGQEEEPTREEADEAFAMATEVYRVIVDTLLYRKRRVREAFILTDL